MIDFATQKGSIHNLKVAQHKIKYKVLKYSRQPKKCFKAFERKQSGLERSCFRLDINNKRNKKFSSFDCGYMK